MHSKGILFVTHVGDPGGAEYKMLDLCRTFRGCCEVMLLQRGSLTRTLDAEGIPHSVCEMSASARTVRREAGLIGVLRAVPAVLSMIGRVGRRARRFDVVVCFSQKSFVLASLAKPITRRPIVWFMNDILSREHFSPVLIRFLVMLSRFSAAHIALNSQASLESWLRSGGRASRVSVIYPGVEERLVGAQLRDSERIALWRHEHSPQGRPLIGMFGRLSRWKGQDVFLRALARLPGVNAVIVGAALFGEEDYERRVRALAQELGVADRVRFLGHLDEAITMMAACDVVAHCSTAPEPFGLVIAEAMLAGTPVIASDAGGAREIVVQGETGQLTPLGDDEALASAIRRYLEDREWAQGVARKARDRAASLFSVSAMTAGFTRVLESL